MNNINDCFDKLRRYCETQDFKGYDPYDGLNSPFSKLYPFSNSNLLRLIWIQTFKRFPFNIRPLFLIKKEYNPKGIALFLTGYCNLYNATKNDNYLKKVHYLSKILIRMQTKGFSGSCWGYNFPWQSRLGLIPKGFPNVVTTSYASYALMDAYGCTNKLEYLDVATSSCNFILRDLKRTKRGDGFIFSYSPLKSNCVYNASLLASRVLSRAFYFLKDKSLLDYAMASVLACCSAQKNDGAWAYGESSSQNWIDSFHTGYNLECISEYQKYSRDLSFYSNLKKGLHYYIANFFIDDGTPKYFDNKIYPIDIHSPSQFIVTLFRMNKLAIHRNRVDKILSWTINNMFDKFCGFFFYQLHQNYTIKIPYMRWTQAWMFYALSFYLLFYKETGLNHRIC